MVFLSAMDKKPIKTSKGPVPAADHIVKSTKTGKVPDDAVEKADGSKDR